MLRIVALSILLILQGCSGTALFIANTIASLGDHKVERDIAYGELEDEVLDIYLPDAEGEKPVVVFFYGGCWGACLHYTRESYEFLAEAFTDEGYIVIVPDYPHYPDLLYEDIMRSAARVIDWVDANIGDYGGDAAHMLLSGHSAGAHMAAMLALDERWLVNGTRSASLTGFIGFAGPYDFLPFTDDYQYELFGPEEKFDASQPINFVDGIEIPMLLLHGKDDTRVRPKNSKNLAASLQVFESDVELKLYDDIDHTGLLASLATPYRERRPVMQDIRKFLSERSHRNRR